MDIACTALMEALLDTLSGSGKMEELQVLTGLYLCAAPAVCMKGWQEGHEEAQLDAVPKLLCIVSVTRA